MDKRKLLLATTNDAKAREMHDFLADLPFEFVTLHDVEQTITAPDETGETIEANALLKALYYAKKTGLLSLADDSGLFLDAFAGWPGLTSARIAPDAHARNAAVIERLENEQIANRTAAFRCVLTIADPETGNVFSSTGETKGRIAAELPKSTENMFGYDPIFYPDGSEKTYADMTLQEKQAISHRGKALFQMKYLLHHQYGGEHIVVPFAIIIRDGKILMAKRNDPHRPEFHGKWEFPGGRMEVGETMEHNVVREVSEEVGYNVEVVQRLNTIGINHWSGKTWAYQVYLVPFVCRIIGGEGHFRDAEVQAVQWYTTNEILTLDLIGANMSVYEEFLPELKSLLNTTTF